MLYLTLRHYEYVCAVAHHCSLSAAAEALHVSQPALSAALSRIEEHLGHALFLRRRGAPLALTPQGRSFTKRAQSLVDQAAQLESPNATAPIAQKLVLGCFSDLAPFLLAPALQHLRSALPDLAITPRVGDFATLTEAMLQGEIDFAFTYDLGLDAGFARQIMDHRRPHILVQPGHRLAEHPAVALADVAPEPLILSQEGLSVQHMLSLFKSRNLSPRIAHRAASLELLRSLAANGEGVGISYSAPPLDLSYDGKPLISVPVSDEIAREPVILASHGIPHSESSQAMATSLLTEFFTKPDRNQN